MSTQVPHLIPRETLEQLLRDALTEAVSVGVLSPAEIQRFLRSCNQPPLDCHFALSGAERRWFRNLLLKLDEAQALNSAVIKDGVK